MKSSAGAWVTAMALVAGGTTGVLGAGGQAIPADPERAAQMRDHYRDAIEMHTATIRGDLAGVASAAEALINFTPPPGMPTRSATAVAALRRSAQDIANSTTIVSAAASSALLFSACGQCHRLAGAQPVLRLRSNSDLGGIVGHMLDHQRAADQIFQGLVIPSDAMWRDGARAFAVAPLHSGDLPVGALERRKLSATEEKIHRLATDAAQATDARARANYYGQLLAGCADCHSRSKKWGPGG